MNIFFLHTNPEKAAQAHGDEHLRKMILESAQLLQMSEVLRGENVMLKNHTKLYLDRHLKHPCTLWTAQHLRHYFWLSRLLTCLLQEFRYRRNKPHAYEKTVLKDLNKTIAQLEPLVQNPYAVDMESFPSSFHPHCNLNLYITDYQNTVASYRLYYLLEKQHLLNYTVRTPPVWLLAQRCDTFTIIERGPLTQARLNERMASSLLRSFRDGSNPALEYP